MLEAKRCSQCSVRNNIFVRRILQAARQHCHYSWLFSTLRTTSSPLPAFRMGWRLRVKFQLFPFHKLRSASEFPRKLLTEFYLTAHVLLCEMSFVC